jgi:hypothetical protein
VFPPSEEESDVSVLLQISVRTNCEKCSSVETATLKFNSLRVGSYLIIVIKRQINDRKNDSRVKFPLDLSLPSFGSCSLKLRCVIEHIGKHTHTRATLSHG